MGTQQHAVSGAQSAIMQVVREAARIWTSPGQRGEEETSLNPSTARDDLTILVVDDEPKKLSEKSIRVVMERSKQPKIL